ncbi:CatB-related O-acetyltransferase [Rossellomorea aquimaris]|uniref:CatB-related O-acetyltransferase n=1 Tax=Rossellomorea aquimaris TaxID=189382 RepID=UPI0037C93D62
MKYFLKRVLTFIISIFRKDLLIDQFSEINPIKLKLLKGNPDNRIIIKKSILSGEIVAKQGCKLSNVTCSGNVKLGSFVSLNGPGTRISSRLEGIDIGSFSSVASNVIIQEDYHRIDKVSTYFMNQNIFKDDLENDIYTKGKIIIEEDVWVGSNSAILSGVKIGRGSIIGAGSVITKDIPRYSIVAGNPATLIKKRFPEHVINKLEESNWWEYDIEEILKLKKEFNINLNEIKAEENIFR